MLLIKSHKASTKDFTENIALILGQSLDLLLLLNPLQPIFPTRTTLKNASLIHRLATDTFLAPLIASLKFPVNLGFLSCFVMQDL